MKMDEQTIREVLEGGAASLPHLKHLLAASDIERATRVANMVRLQNIFPLLDSQNPEQAETACEVLSLAFQILPVALVAEQVKDRVLNSLLHSNGAVRYMAINQMSRFICGDDDVYPLPENMDVAFEIVRCVGDEQLNVAIKALDIIAFKNWLLCDPILCELDKLMMSSNTSTKCRCYEIVIKAVKKNPDWIKSENAEKLLHRLISDLDTNDALYQLNVLELLSDLSISPHGLGFLVSNDVLKKLSTLVQSLDSNPTANLIIPGLMKFFGAIAYLYPTEIYDNYPTIVSALFDAIRENNRAILPTALDTLGFVSATTEGKLALGALGRTITDILPDIGNYVKNSPTELRVRAMNCVENMIGMKQAEDDPEVLVDQRITLMTREWFRGLSEMPPSIDVIYGICKNPFPELRISALNVLAAVCQHGWGQELVKNTGGLIEFLLDRTVEHEKESKHIKYDIISRLAKSNIFDESTLIRFNEFVKEGPFFVNAIAEVAFEGEE